MIFITLGSQKFQFNRLLIEIDKLVKEEKITKRVFAQIGYSDYKPKYYEYKEFLNRDEFTEVMKRCDKVITHGGTGAIMGAIKQGKKVIAIPRLNKFGEHVDDHQLQITEQFKEMRFIESISEIENINIAIDKLENMEFNKYVSSTSNIITAIDNFINNR